MPFFTHGASSSFSSAATSNDYAAPYADRRIASTQPSTSAGFSQRASSPIVAALPPQPLTADDVDAQLPAIPLSGDKKGFLDRHIAVARNEVAPRSSDMLQIARIEKTYPPNQRVGLDTIGRRYHMEHPNNLSSYMRANGDLKPAGHAVIRKENP
jgi:hypothetical protein